MTEPPTGRRDRRPALIFAGAALLLGGAAALQMFSVFMFYDDEGYVLITLRNFIQHGGLYRDVYTQYGPFPYVFYYLLHLAGLPLTHTAGRALTILAWAGAATSCAAIAWFATRRLLLALAVLAGAFAYLWIMASEPSHPGGLIVFLTTALGALGYRWLAADRVSPWAVAVGTVTAALVLTKINVGAFLAAAALAWWLLHHRADRLRRWAPAIVSAGVVALPLGLMRPLLGTPWVSTYAIVFIASALAAVAAISLACGPRTTWPHLLGGAAGGAALSVVILGVIFARGTTPADLLEGILLGPLRQPTSFSLRYLWAPGIGYFAAASLLICIVFCRWRHRGTPWVHLTVALGRLIAVAALALNVGLYPRHSPDYLVFGWAMPCVWLFLWPLPGSAPAVLHARNWLGLLFLGQCLHVFPVPGSQIAWATILALPIAAISGWEAAVWLREQYPAARRPAFAWPLRAAVAAFALLTGGRFCEVALRYREGSNLALPGAEMLRLPDSAAALFRILAVNAAAHSDVLFSLPGMFSLNLWSGAPTPTAANVTHWFSLLNADQQNEIMRSLESHPRACVVVHREHINFLAGRGLPPRGPLYDFIAREFEPAFVIDDFEFSVRRGRKIQPFLVADILARADDHGGAVTGREDTLLKFALLVPPPSPIARIEISTAAGPHAAPLVLDAQSARAELAAASPRRDGTPNTTAPWPLRCTGPTVISLFYERANKPRPLQGGLVVLRDAAGHEVGLARVAR